MRKKPMLIILLIVVVLGLTSYAIFHKNDGTGSASSGPVKVINNQTILSKLSVSRQSRVSFVANPTSPSAGQLMSVSGQITSTATAKLTTVTLSVAVQGKDSNKMLGSFVTNIYDVLPGTTSSFSFTHKALSTDQNVTLIINPVDAQ